MSDMQDQPSGGGTARPGTAAGPATSTGPGSAAGASGARGGYVPRPAPGYDDVQYEKQGPSGFALGMTLVAAVFMMIGGLFDFFEGLAA